MFEEIDLKQESKPGLDLELDVEMTESNSRSNLAVMDIRNSSAISPRVGNAVVVTEHEPHYTATWKYYFIKLVFHISFHITLLSTLEPLFFFNYAIPMEREMFYEQIGDLTTYQSDSFKSHDAQSIRSQPFYTLFIQFLQYENVDTDSTLISMSEDSAAAKAENDAYNAELEYIGYTFPVFIGSFTVAYYIIIQYVYRYKNFGIQVLGEHLSLMMFVAAYEFWFFTNVILKYHPFTTEQIMELIANCMFVRLYEYYPEMRVIEHNETATCDSK